MTARPKGTLPIADLHLWRLGPGQVGVILTLVSDHPEDPSIYKRRIAAVHGPSHKTIEVNRRKQGHAKAA